VEGFIPSWKGSSAKRYRFKSSINGNRRIAVASPGGDKPLPYRSHPVADKDIICGLLSANGFNPARAGLTVQGCG
jgi:hypothetical protein